MVLMLGAILLVVATTVFSFSLNNARTTTGERSRTEAYLSADSALAYLRNTLGSQLLGLDDRGEPVPADGGPFGLYRRGEQFYFGYPKLDTQGTVLGMHDLVNPAALPDRFEDTKFKDSTPQQRWWVHQLGAVRWIPLSVAQVAEGDGVVPVAIRQVEVVGESGSEGLDGRSAVSQTLRLAVDLKGQSVTRRPEVALGVVSVARYNPEQQPSFLLKGSTDQQSRVRIEGPVLVDTPRVAGEWGRLEGKAKVTIAVARNPETAASYAEASGETPAQPLNPALFPYAGNKEQAIIAQGGERRFSRPGEIEFEGNFESFEEEASPGTLQLTVPFAEMIGRAGTVLRKSFNPRHNIKNPRGERIYDAQKALFDFTKARRGIFYVENKSLLLKGEPFKVFTYQGQGTLVITGTDNCLTLENASLVPVSAADSLTIICALQPPDPAAASAASAAAASVPTDTSTASSATDISTTTTRTATNPNERPQGTARAPQPPPKPVGIKVLFSAAIPSMVLANNRGVPFTVPKAVLENDFGAPPNLPTTLKRLFTGVGVEGVNIPSGARAVTLDQRNYVLARLSEQERPEVLVSIGVNSDKQRSSLQLEGISGAQVVPLVRLQAQVFSNAPFTSEGSVRIVGSLIAPSISIAQGRYAPNTQNLLYGDSKFGLRFLFDAQYRRMPLGTGGQLMTFRPRRRPEPFLPAVVARVDGLLWQRSNFEQWRNPPPVNLSEANPETP